MPSSLAKSAPMNDRVYTFTGGESGQWIVSEIRTVIGPPVEAVPFLDVRQADVRDLAEGARWLMRGVTSNQRYTNRAEQVALAAVQPPLGRPEATRAALIPITKTPAWWALSQDERREIFEARSSHIAVGMRYLPAIARRLHHCRDLGEPFDFLTWFEFAPSDEAAFDELVSALRSTEEWKYVEREVDIRLSSKDS